MAISDGRKIDAPRLVEVKAHHMAEAFTRVVSFKRFDKRAEEWVNSDCPHRIAETFLVREGGWDINDVDTMLNKRSGMLGLCGYTDMRDVEAQNDAGKR